MKIGTSNQLKGTVVYVHEGAVNGTVGIELPSGQVISSSITMDSIEKLGLEVGMPAYACIKATDVIICVD
ncbi:MAG: molybdopterin-binding protein [Coriobacteriales bacterium]